MMHVSFSVEVVVRVVRGSDEVGRSLFLAFEDKTLLVGTSPSHRQLWEDHCANRGIQADVLPKLFTAGRSVKGKLELGCKDFPCTTESWKRAVMIEFFAGLGPDAVIANAENSRRVALQMTLANKKEESLEPIRHLLEAASVMKTAGEGIKKHL